MTPLTDAQRTRRRALEVACAIGSTQLVEALLGTTPLAGLDISSPNECGWSPIYIAARKGYADIVQLLATAGANITVTDEDGRTPLYAAALGGGYVDVVKVLLGYGADASTPNNFGMTPLNVVATDGYAELARLLIDFGVNVEEPEHGGWTPLCSAAGGGFVEILNLLLDHGAKVEARLHDGSSALYLAASGGHLDAIRILIDRGLDINEKDDLGSTPLAIACLNNHLEAARYLIARGADVLTSNANGWTPLMSAARENLVQTLCLLIQNGADVAATKEDDWTALGLAALGGHFEACLELVDAGADMSSGTDRAWPPLLVAADHAHEQIVRLFLERGADIEMVDPGEHACGWTALSCACHHGHIEMVKTLLEFGSNVNHRDSIGATPLFLAASNGHEETIRVLIEAGADLSIPNRSDATPLHAAVWHSQPGAANLLLELGEGKFDFDSVDTDHYTPLMASAKRGYNAIVTKLLDKGARVSTVDKAGWASLHLAATEGRVDVVKTLLSRGAKLEASVGDHTITALAVASHHGHPDVVNIFLEHGDDIHLRDDLGRTPLHSAVNEGHLEVVTILLKAGSDIATADNDKKGLLVSACLRGHLPIIQTLLNEVPGDLPLLDEDNMSPVFAASLQGHVDVLEFLLDRGFSLSDATTAGWMPIGAASEMGHAEVVKILLEKGAVMSPNAAGFLPIHTASFCGHVPVMQVLAEYGADLGGQVGELDLAPLAIAALNGRVEAVEYLLDQGVDISPHEKYGNTVLHIAASRGQSDIVKVLLARGFDISAKDMNGDTPLHAAVNESRLAVAEVLLEEGVDVNAVNNSDSTPLFRAESFDIMLLLLDYGAEPNVSDDCGFYPIHGAAVRGDMEQMKLLLNHGAHLAVAEQNGATPLFLAMSGGFTKLTKWLVELYADPVITERDGRPPVPAKLLSGHVFGARKTAFVEGKGDLDERFAAMELNAENSTSQPMIPDLPSLLKEDNQAGQAQRIVPKFGAQPPPTEIQGEDSQTQLIPRPEDFEAEHHPSSVSGPLCIPCRLIFEYQVGKLPFDIWYMINIVSNKDPGSGSSLPPANDKAPGFLHHWSAHNMQAAVASGCYICERAWQKIPLEVKDELLREELTKTDEEKEPFTYGMLFDQEYVLKIMADGHPDQEHVPEDSETGKIWSIVFCERVMGLIQLEPANIPMYSLVPEKAVEKSDPGEVITSTRTDSDESLAFALSQFETCVEEHEECRKARETNWLPSRLICLDDGVGDQIDARLVWSQDIERPSSYCTLSHCWGTAQVVKLTKQNIESFLEQLPMTELPRTFRDAFFVARRLGIRYIWIDSLCIVQDNPEDWLDEASQMHSVYINSLCNICATGSSDSSKGLFVNRDPRAFRSCDAWIPWLSTEGTFGVMDITMWRNQVLGSPLHSRAWVVQEHLLSPRQLHFGGTQILWECLRVTSAEQFPRGLPKAIPNLGHWSRRQLHEIPGHPGSDTDSEAKKAAKARTALLSGWSHIVKSYMKAQLSHAGDKVIAFAGIARRFEAIINDKCVAGLWQKNIENGLLWHVEYCRQGDGSPSFRPETYRAPSFSWMSVEGSINAGVEDKSDENANDILVRLLSLDVSESRGVIAPGASIRIECSIKPMKIRRHVSSSGVLWLARFRHGKPQLGWALSLVCTVLMDEDKDYGGSVFYCMTIRKRYAENFVAGLVLEETGGVKGEFRRVGYFQAGGEDKQLLTNPYVDEGDFPCEKYDALAKRHTISII